MQERHEYDEAVADFAETLKGYKLFSADSFEILAEMLMNKDLVYVHNTKTWAYRKHHEPKVWNHCDTFEAVVTEAIFNKYYYSE